MMVNSCACGVAIAVLMHIDWLYAAVGYEVNCASTSVTETLAVVEDQAGSLEGIHVE